MTWLIDARTFAAKPTGVGMYAYRLAKTMLGEGRFVLVSDVEDSAEIADLKRRGCEVRAYGKRVCRSAGVLGYFRFVQRVVREVRPDVFWQPNNLQPFRVRDVPRVIVTIHDVYGLGWCWRYWRWHLYYRVNFWRTLGNVTEIWYNSEQTRREVRGKVGEGKWRWAEKVTHPIAEVPEAASVAPYAHVRPYFLYLGNVETRKGADILVAAYRRYRDSCGGEPFDLVIAGAARNVPVPDEPGFVPLGYVDDATKFSLMRSCVALVVPSRAEGYGMQVAEALKLGIRVVASDLPVFGEVTENESGCGGLISLRGFADGCDERRVALLCEALRALVV